MTVAIPYSYTGSLAALIQSSAYAGSTGGIFSALQSFGATAAVAPPVALALGGTLLIVGAAAGGYWLYQRRQRRLDAEAQAAGGDDDSDDDDEHPPKEIQPLIKRVSVSERFPFILLIYSIPVSAYAVQHFRHISPLFKRLNNDPLQAEDRKNERVILDNLMPKYINVTLLVYFSNKWAQNFERHAVSTFTYICSSRLRCECLADRGGTSASFLPFFEVPVFVICYMLHDSSNERVAHLVSRQCRTSFVVGQRTPYFKLLSCEKGANSRRTIQPSLMYVGLQSSAYIYYLFLKPS